EGETQGALLLARRAADAYDPSAREPLANVYWLIHQCEEALHRPVASRAALRIVLRCEPGAEEVQQAFDHFFGPDGVLPAAARREYPLLPPASTARAGSRASWDQALAGATTGRLADVARGFEAITKEEPSDAAAWYNLAVGKAWLGDNQGALQAIDRYIDLETDEARATTATTLAEVLRTGAGLEEECDYHEYAFSHQLRNPAPVQALVNEWMQTRRLIPLH